MLSLHQRAQKKNSDSSAFLFFFILDRDRLSFIDMMHIVPLESCHKGYISIPGMFWVTSYTL